MAISASQNTEGTASSFQTNQILCIEYDDTQLFAETIQVVEARGLCWVRPLLLVMASQSVTAPGEWDEKEFYDLRQGVDLLCPIALFRAAWDTEVIPLIEKLNYIKQFESDDLEERTTSQQMAHTQLREFINRIWENRPDAFQP